MSEWFLEIDYATVVIFASAVSALLIQLLLCFKAKRAIIKLLPIILLIASTIVLYVCAVTVNGWDGFGYLFFAFLSLGLTFICGIGWGIWAIIQKMNR